MPNDCYNKVWFENLPPKELNEIVGACNEKKNPFEALKDFNKIFEKPPRESKEIDAMYRGEGIRSLVKPPTSWFDLIMTEYGFECKQDGSTVSIEFITWDVPPISLYNRLSKSGFAIHACYFESGRHIYGVYDHGYDFRIEGIDPHSHQVPTYLKKRDREYFHVKMVENDYYDDECDDECDAECDDSSDY